MSTGNRWIALRGVLATALLAALAGVSRAGTLVNFGKARQAYIRVNGDQKATFDALINGLQIINEGGKPRANYVAAGNHTLIFPQVSGTVFVVH